MNGLYQCCYTNAQVNIDGVVTPGWQAVAVSPGIPTAAYERCVRIQSVNSSISGSAVDEHGDVLNLLELESDEAYLYIVHTQYGLLDRVGRSNMFSHGFIVPWSQNDALRDPNVFLTIDDSNFKTSTSEALHKEKSIVSDSPFAFDGTLEVLDIDREEYLILIQCVYTKLTVRTIRWY